MAEDKVPVLLLKTKSTPGDAYEDIFSQPQHELTFDPSFVPVLEHTFDKQGLASVGSVLESRQIGSHPGACYGGLIFTSQRAVEAFAKLVQDGQGEIYPALDSIPFHTRDFSPISCSPREQDPSKNGRIFKAYRYTA